MKQELLERIEERVLSFPSLLCALREIILLKVKKLDIVEQAEDILK